MRKRPRLFPGCIRQLIILSDLKEVNELYFQFPIEKRATEWGANYMREHANKVAELWDKLTTVFMEVYELNEVEM